MRQLFTAFSLFFLLGLFGCCTDQGPSGPPYGQCTHLWFSAQVLNPDAPADPTPAMVLPGKVAAEIYEKRYIPAMTEKKKEERAKMESQYGD
ncbi:MAG: hypothetical protein GX443_11595 [Deltaproteobacteria bacterium]|nr:hypothetical protein [Deltaproteobacteria bacterium]